MQRIIETLNYTGTQCIDIMQQQYVPAIGLAAFGLLLATVMIFTLLIRNQKYLGFIKDSKLEKKYQEWKKDNQGLN